MVGFAAGIGMWGLNYTLWKNRTVIGELGTTVHFTLKDLVTSFTIPSANYRPHRCRAIDRVVFCSSLVPFMPFFDGMRVWGVCAVGNEERGCAKGALCSALVSVVL